MQSEEKRQYLDFIQSAIAKMGANSFQIKGMTVAIVAALLAVYAAVNEISYIFISIGVTVLLLLLDTYYLRLERKFRALYNDVSEITSPPQNPIVLYSMKVDEYTGGNLQFFKVISSPSIIIFYPLIILLLGLIVWLH